MSTEVTRAEPGALRYAGLRAVQRVKGWLDGIEGSWRGPFFGQGFLGHWFQLGSIEDGYQRDLRVDRYGMNYIPAIAGLRHLHRSAFSQLRPHHMREDEHGAITDLRNSAQLRVMLKPNDYETGADFNARLADLWMTRGEVLVWGVRNDRSEVAQMHILPADNWRLVVDPETQTVFYAVRRGASDLLSVAAGDFILPSRDVMHLRWATPRHPLIGESGFAAAGLAAGINVALSHSQAAFFAQMRRPSGILSTEQQLNKIQIMQLREAFDAQSKAMAQGGMPIMSSGLKWQQMGISSEDAEVISALRMSNEEMARCVGVPGPLIGDLEKSGLTNTEALIEFWLSLSLGGLIERFETNLNQLLGLDGRSDWVDMSTEALLRTNLVQRMEGLTKGVMGGVLAPNEARRREGLSPVPGGDQVFLQKQNVPVNLLGELAAADLQAANTPALPAPVPEDDEVVPDPEDDTAKHIDDLRRQLAEQDLDVAAVKRAIEALLPAVALEPIADRLADLVQRLGVVESAPADVARVAMQPMIDSTVEALEDLQREKVKLQEATHRIERMADAMRAQVAEGVLNLERTLASVRDGRDGVGIRALSLSDDEQMLTFEFTDDTRFECPLLRGRQGDRGDAGLGIDAPAWVAGVHRAGTIVQHFEGRLYRALLDTADEPGDSSGWERIGLLGQRWTGPFSEYRTYEAGDLYVKGGTFQVLASGEHRCVAPKPLTPSEVRTISIRQWEEREAGLREELGATQAALKSTAEQLVIALDALQTLTAQSGAQLELIEAQRRDIDALAQQGTQMRAFLESQVKS